MRHVIFGGDGFVGRHLAPKLLADGEEVIVADVAKSELPHYRQARFVQCDVTDPAAVESVGIRPDDMIYNLSAKMLSPIQRPGTKAVYVWSSTVSSAGPTRAAMALGAIFRSALRRVMGRKLATASRGAFPPLYSRLRTPMRIVLLSCGRAAVELKASC